LPKTGLWLTAMIGVALAIPFAPAALRAQPIPGALAESTKALAQGEWPAYAGSYAASHYSPLTQIDRGNAKGLHIAWRWKSPDQPIKAAKPLIGPSFANESTPLMVGGTLTNEQVGLFALNGHDVANIGSVMNRGTVYIASAATLNVTGGSHATGTALAGYVQTAGQTTVDGELKVMGRGMVNFAGGSVYGNGGTITGSVTSNAAINLGDSPLTVGQLTFVGNYTQGPLGSLTIDIAGLEQYDQLNITGHAQLNGLLSIDLLDNYVPQLGDTFDIMNFANQSGTFSLVMGLPINGEEHFILEYNPTNLTLDVVAGPLLSPVSGKEGLPATVPFIIQPDNDGTTLIASNIESGSAPYYGGSPATPEPGSLLLLVSGLLCVGYSVRRRMTK